MDCSHLLEYARVLKKGKLNNILCTILHNICKDKSYKIPLLTQTFLKDFMFNSSFVYLLSKNTINAPECILTSLDNMEIR